MSVNIHKDIHRQFVFSNNRIKSERVKYDSYFEMYNVYKYSIQSPYDMMAAMCCGFTCEVRIVIFISSLKI